MGEGYIISGGSKALYKIQIIKHEGNAPERLKTIEQLLINIEELLERLTTDYATLLSAVNTAQADYLDASERYRLGTITISVLITKRSDVTKAQQALYANKKEQAYLKLQKLELLKEKEKLEAALEAVYKNLWCVDFTTGILPGRKVGLLELDGDFNWINIEEGCENSKAEGKMQPVELSTPAGTFYNLALMPCWQRHRPYYRAGRISNIDYVANHADVTLDNPNYSSATKVCGEHNTIPINQFSNNPETPETGVSLFRHVPFKYMGCNSAAFINGDHVIVRFEEHNWMKPVIIGFHDNPRPALNLIQISFDNIVTNPDLMAEFDAMIADLNLLIGYYTDYRNVTCPQFIAMANAMVGKIKGMVYVFQG